MALWGNNDNIQAGGTVALDYDTLVVTGTGTSFGTANYIQEGDVTYVMLPNGEVKKVDGNISDYTRDKMRYRPGQFQGGKA